MIYLHVWALVYVHTPNIFYITLEDGGSTLGQSFLEVSFQFSSTCDLKESFRFSQNWHEIKIRNEYKIIKIQI